MRKDGSLTIEKCLAQLVRPGVLTVDDARARAMHREELDALLGAGRV